MNKRGAMIQSLLVPIYLLAASALITIIVLWHGRVPANGFTYWFGGLSFSYTALSPIWLPAYMLAIIIFIRKTKECDDVVLRKHFFRVPVNTGLLIWFPTIFIVIQQGLGFFGGLKSYMLLLLLVLVIAYPGLMVAHFLVSRMYKQG
jgi:hypothetical protein